MSRPTGITADRERKQVTITWEDEHESHYSFSILRFACPCAECRGGHAQMGDEPDKVVFDLPEEDTLATAIQQIEPVGAYAITIQWGDGHHYGIYKWDYLRALCSCNECRSRRSDGR